MNLAPQLGLRSVYTWTEVMEFLAMDRNQVRWLVQSGKLRKAYSGKFPFEQKDLNHFLTKLNNGKVG